MAKKTSSIDEHLQANPMAQAHSKVIKSTIKALKSLEKEGFPAREYDLGPSYGGHAPSRSGKKGLKMTYCA